MISSIDRCDVTPGEDIAGFHGIIPGSDHGSVRPQPCNVRIAAGDIRNHPPIVGCEQPGIRLFYLPIGLIRQQHHRTITGQSCRKRGTGADIHDISPVERFIDLMALAGYEYRSVGFQTKNIFGSRRKRNDIVPIGDSAIVIAFIAYHCTVFFQTIDLLIADGDSCDILPAGDGAALPGTIPAGGKDGSIRPQTNRKEG